MEEGRRGKVARRDGRERGGLKRRKGIRWLPREIGRAESRYRYTLVPTSAKSKNKFLFVEV